MVGGTSRRNSMSRTVERAALVLACFSMEEPYQTLATLAAKLDLNPSTVYRYIATLQAVGLLQRDEQRGGYRLGLRVIELSYIALDQIEVRKPALEEMDRLRDELDMLVSLAVLIEGDVLHIAHSVPSTWPRWYTTVGRRAVAHCTALGKTIYAYCPWLDVRTTIEKHGWRPYTMHSIRDFDALEAQLALIRERGYAIDNEERNVDTICIGAPIRDHAGAVVAALSVTTTARRLTPKFQEEVSLRVIETANRVAFRLGNYSKGTYS